VARNNAEVSAMHTNVLRIDVSYLGGTVVVTVQGEIDTETAPTFRVALDQIEAHNHAYINMANVRFIDSSGIKVLVAQAIRMQRNNGQLHIQNPSRVVRRIFTVLGLSDYFFEFESTTPLSAIAV
jgi:anti-anti-sigma factor